MSAPKPYGPGNPQCSAIDAAGLHCAGPAGHPDGSDHANINSTWPEGGATVRTRQDIPALLTEVERLRGELETMTDVARGNKRHVADLAFQLERVEALTKDTDGGDVDPDAEIPVGEIRRALYEPLAAAEPGRNHAAVRTGLSTRAVEHALGPVHFPAELAHVRAGERLRVLEEIVALADDKDGLRELVENAAGDPDGKTSLSRARSLLRELAAIGGPLDTATTVTAPNPGDAR